MVKNDHVTSVKNILMQSILLIGQPPLDHAHWTASM